MSRRKLIAGTLTLALANFITKFLGFYYRIYMSDAIGSEGMGLYQLILPIYSLLWSITASGFTTTVSGLTARENAKGETGNIGRIVKQSVIMCFFVSILLSAVLLGFSDYIALHMLKEERTLLSLRLLAFCIPFMAVGSCLRGFFMGLQNMAVPALSQVLEQVMRISSILLLSGIFVPKGLSYACFAAVWGIVLGEALSFFFTLYSYIRFKRKRKFIRKPTLSPHTATIMILTMALPLSFTRITSSLFSAIENILIPTQLQAFGYNRTDALELFGELTGMAMPLLQLPSAFLMAASTSLVPEISQACAVGQNNRINRTISASLLFTAIIGVGATCFFAVFPREISYLVYNKSELGNLLLPMAFVCPLLYGHMTLSGLLNGLGEQLFLFWIHLLSSATTICFILFLMPQYGIYAYLFGWFIGLFFTTILSIVHVKKRAQIQISCLQCLIKPILAGMAAALITRYMIQIGTPSKALFFISFCTMGILYLLFLLCLGCLSKDIWKMVLPKRGLHEK